MIEKIIRIATEAGEILLSYYQKDLEIIDKGSEGLDPVTEADMASHRLITKRLLQEFPDDQILSEENSEAAVDFSGRVWIIDPLDGTKQFIHHEDTFSLVIGLCVNGIPVLGVVHLPVQRITYFAEPGKGAYLLQEEMKQKLSVSKNGKLANAVLFIKSPSQRIRPFEEAIQKLPTKAKILGGSIATKLCDIAAGKADLYIHPSKKLCKWDTCASQLILTEAGGKITDLKGNALDYKQNSNFWEDSIVASNGKIHKKAIFALNKGMIK